jgi:Ca2+-binding RTX toxin-like protein
VGAAAVVVLAAALPATGQAPAAGGDPGEIVSKVVRQSPAEVRDYWTPRRMRRAEPVELRRAELRVPPSDGIADTRGEPKLVLPTGPGVPETRVGILDGLVGTGGEPQARDAVQTGPNNTAFPERVHGKVFFTISGGSDPGDFLCSGTAVRSPSHTLVWTAGHCVNDADFNGGFATNFEFVPGYRDGQQPFGAWVAKELFTTSGWRNNVNIRFDVGAAVLRRDGEGRGIQDVIGARGIAFSQSRNQTFVALGYPADPAYYQPAFNGERLWSCTSQRTGDDNPPGGGGPKPLEIFCDMTGGSSGGSWVVGDQFVNGITSYAYCELPSSPLFCQDPDHLYSPYLGTTAKNLYQEARGKKRKCARTEVTNLGGGGSDDFRGTSRRDSFKLRGGGDTARGRKGKDRLCGGGGNDLLIGGPGFDVCNGGKGRDRARGCEERKKIP